MNPSIDVTILEVHWPQLSNMLSDGNGVEAAGYIYFGISEIENDPWEKDPRIRMMKESKKQHSEIRSNAAKRVSGVSFFGS